MRQIHRHVVLKSAAGAESPVCSILHETLTPLCESGLEKVCHILGFNAWLLLDPDNTLPTSQIASLSICWHRLTESKHQSGMAAAIVACSCLVLI